MNGGANDRRYAFPAYQGLAYLNFQEWYQVCPLSALS